MGSRKNAKIGPIKLPGFCSEAVEYFALFRVLRSSGIHCMSVYPNPNQNGMLDFVNVYVMIEWLNECELYE